MAMALSLYHNTSLLYCTYSALYDQLNDGQSRIEPFLDLLESTRRVKRNLCVDRRSRGWLARKVWSQECYLASPNVLFLLGQYRGL